MSDETNVAENLNAEVGATDTDIQTGTTMSFDDLDELTTTETPEELISEAKKMVEKREEGKQQNKTEDKGEEEKVDVEEGEDKEEEIKYKTGAFDDLSQEIAEGTIFSHKVDGEEVDVTLRDLLDNYAGKIPFDKRFSELDISRKSLETELNEHKQEKEAINEYLQDFATKMKKGDAMGAISFLADFAGMTPYEFRTQLLSNMAPEVDRRRTLTEEQAANEQLQAENEYLSRQRESAETDLARQQSHKELEKRMAELQETHEISDEDFDIAYKELQDTDLKDQLSPDLVAKYYLHKNAFNRADTVLSESYPNLVSNDKVINAVQQLILDHPDFTDENLVEIVKTVYGEEKKKASKAVSKKIPGKSKKQSQGTSEEYEDYVDFDDL